MLPLGNSKVVCLLVGLLYIQCSFRTLLLARSAPPETSVESPFFIIVDGGSTGSRLHIYEFVTNSDRETHCVRRGSARVQVPLSHHSHRPPLSQDVAQHMMPLFEYAALQIPSRYHNITTVKIQATAGMRLLDESTQSHMYDALYHELMHNSSFVFTAMRRWDIATLSGKLEGFYGVVAANYLQGNIDSFLNIQSNTVDTQGLTGALDMGGSSTQIVYFAPETNNTFTLTGIPDGSMEDKLHPQHFVSISHLSFGVDQFRQRLLDLWLQEHYTLHHATINIPNPCHFKGYILEYKNSTFIGTGNASQCAMEINRLLPHPPTFQDTTPSFSSFFQSSSTQRRMVGGVQYPALQGKFIAMSLYFFTLDCLRELSTHEPLKESWPSPTIQDLATALDSLCSRHWQGDLQLIQHEAHTYTRADVLPDRCFESVYMVSLLRDGYGFHPSSQDITFSYLVQGSEVEWSLGLALSLFAQQDHENRISSELLEQVVEQSNSLWSSWDKSVQEGNQRGGNVTTYKSLSQFLSDIIAHVPHWVSAMSYQDIATGRGHLLIL